MDWLFVLFTTGYRLWWYSPLLVMCAWAVPLHVEALYTLIALWLVPLGQLVTIVLAYPIFKRRRLLSDVVLWTVSQVYMSMIYSIYLADLPYAYYVGMPLLGCGMAVLVWFHGNLCRTAIQKVLFFAGISFHIIAYYYFFFLKDDDGYARFFASFGFLLTSGVIMEIWSALVRQQRDGKQTPLVDDGPNYDSVGYV